MSKATIKAEIDANITQNGTGAITGNILNGVLNDMVDDYATQEEATSISQKLNGVNSSFSIQARYSVGEYKPFLFENGKTYHITISANGSSVGYIPMVAKQEGEQVAMIVGSFSGNKEFNYVANDDYSYFFIYAQGAVRFDVNIKSSDGSISDLVSKHEILFNNIQGLSNLTSVDPTLIQTIKCLADNGRLKENLIQQDSEIDGYYINNTIITPHQSFKLVFFDVSAYRFIHIKYRVGGTIVPFAFANSNSLDSLNLQSIVPAALTWGQLYDDIYIHDNTYSYLVFSVNKNYVAEDGFTPIVRGLVSGDADKTLATKVSLLEKTIGHKMEGVVVSALADSLGANWRYFDDLVNRLGISVVGSQHGGTSYTNGGSGNIPYYSDYRINQLGASAKAVFLQGGTNDFAECGEISFTNTDTSTLCGAFNVTLSKIYYKYRLSDGYYDNIDYSGVVRGESVDKLPIFVIIPPYLISDARSRIETNREYLKQIAHLWGLPVIDAWDIFCNPIVWENADQLHGIMDYFNFLSAKVYSAFVEYIG